MLHILQPPEQNTVPKLTWVIEPGDDGDNLLEALGRQQINALSLSFMDLVLDKCPAFGPDDCVVCYGSTNVIRKLAAKKLSPGPWCAFQNFQFSTYSTYLGDFLLNRRYFLMPFVELCRRINEIAGYLGTNDEIFIRPNTGVKTFSGHVLKISECELLSEYTRADALVVVAKPVNQIDVEWRYVIVNKSILTSSPYSINGEIQLDFDTMDPAIRDNAGANEFVNQILNRLKELDWEPDIAWVLDVCLVQNNYYAVEINSFSCSGLYRCDYDKIVRTISDVALTEWKEQAKLI